MQVSPSEQLQKGHAGRGKRSPVASIAVCTRDSRQLGIESICNYLIESVSIKKSFPFMSLSLWNTARIGWGSCAIYSIAQGYNPRDARAAPSFRVLSISWKSDTIYFNLLLYARPQLLLWLEIPITNIYGVTRRRVLFDFFRHTSLFSHLNGWLVGRSVAGWLRYIVTIITNSRL